MFSKNSKFSFIDLFAGAGGLSEGFIRAGYNPIAHVEMNPQACMTLETRSCYHYLRNIGALAFYYDYLRGKITRAELLGRIPSDLLKTIICAEMSNSTIYGIFQKIDSIMNVIGETHIDVIIGGPPCQAYSLVGRAQSSHMERPMAEDPRNYLYLLYALFLTHYQPTMFVFENVIGIRSANGGETWRSLQAELQRAGYEIECREQNAYDFGVIQNRRRMIVVGWRTGNGLRYPDFEVFQNQTTVSELLQDLPHLKPGQEKRRYSSIPMCRYLEDKQIRTKEDILTLHKSRPNTKQDVEIYIRAIDLWNNHNQRLNYNDLPEELKTHRNRTSFIDRYKVINGKGNKCHTILAHLSKDGHYFIHPDRSQHRSITVREAARLQSFPDSYFFEGGRTAQFVQVGNAVPPMMAYGIASALRKILEEHRE